MNNLNIEFFAIIMKKKREELKMTQKELASIVKLTPTTISSYEKHMKFPTLENAIAIANALNCSLDEMCGVENKIGYSSYSDIITQLTTIMELIDCYIVEGVAFLNTDNIYGDAILFDNKLIQRFLKDWNKIRLLYLNKTIDEELYTAWKEKKIREYRILINADGEGYAGVGYKPSEIQTTLEDLQNDDDLPF